MAQRTLGDTGTGASPGTVEFEVVVIGTASHRRPDFEMDQNSSKKPIKSTGASSDQPNLDSSDAGSGYNGSLLNESAVFRVAAS
jgi:hypothetical protein